MPRLLTLVLSLALVSVATIPAVAQVVAAGPQVLTFHSEVDDTEQPYALYLPPDYDPARAYPLVVSLHGAGSNHRLNLRRVFGKSNAEGESDAEASRYFPEWADVDYIVASPFARGTMGYQGVAERDVLAVLSDVRRRFTIDENRMYLTGLSMGGGGTLWVGLTRPDLWAAIAPVCPAPPAETALYAGNALNLPIHVMQGDADPVVRPEMVREFVALLRAADAPVEYVEYPGVGHDAWVPAYADGRIFDWFAQHTRDPYPDRVRFTTARYAYDDAYWVTLDALTPGTPARIDARFTGPNRLEITTEALGGFTLRLDDHPQRTGSGALDVRIDGAPVAGATGATVSFHRADGAWRVGPAPRPALAKAPGQEGPMEAVLADRHVYVYGTAGDPAPAEMAARRTEAATAGTWSVDRGAFWGRVMVFPRILSDREVRPSDREEGNLVLFGDAATNTVLADLADALPMRLADGADETYGLVYAYPAGDRMVLVASGRPWWTPAEGAGAPNPFTSQVPALMLGGRGDYVLFRGSLADVVAEGRFDEAWQLPDAAREALEATGVVEVR